MVEWIIAFNFLKLTENYKPTDPRTSGNPKHRQHEEKYTKTYKSQIVQNDTEKFKKQPGKVTREKAKQDKTRKCVVDNIFLIKNNASENAPIRHWSNIFNVWKEKKFANPEFFTQWKYVSKMKVK